MEERIQALEGVESATITFATKQLRLRAADPDALLPHIRKICTSIESEVKVVPRNPAPAASTDTTTKTYLLENLAALTALPKWRNKSQTLKHFRSNHHFCNKTASLNCKESGPIPGSDP